MRGLRSFQQSDATLMSKMGNRSGSACYIDRDDHVTLIRSCFGVHPGAVGVVVQRLPLGRCLVRFEDGRERRVEYQSVRRIPQKGEPCTVAT